MELSEYLKVSVKKVKLIKDSVIKEPVSFHTPIAQDLTLEDYIADNVENAPNQRIERYDYGLLVAGIYQRRNAVYVVGHG